MEGSRSRARLATIVLAAVLVALTVFIVISAVLIGRFTAGHAWSAAGLFVIIVVTAVVGLVVVRHQSGNPIGWLLAGTAIFMLLNIAAGSYAQLVYDQGDHALAFAGLPALILSQLFNVSLTGFPLVILLFPDGRLPSRRWRPVLAAYLSSPSSSAPWNPPTSPSGSPRATKSIPRSPAGRRSMALMPFR